MTASDTEAALRAVLQTRAESAMAVTNTERELDELRARLEPAARSRRLRMLAAAAAVATVGTAIGLGIALSGGSTSGSGRTGPATLGSPPASPSWQAAGRVPAGFPAGTFEHPGTFGATTLVLRRNGTASLQDPRGIPTQMQMTFATPDLVRFTDTKPSATTATTSCSDHDGVYRWAVAHGALTLTVVSDPCTNRQIPLSEIAWGPIR